MDISIYKDDLNKAINTVINAKPVKTTKPILEGILIQTNTNQIKLTAADLTIGIEATVSCDVREEGATVVNANVFSEIIKRLPDSEINLKMVGENIIQISCEGSDFKLNTFNPVEFPELPAIDVQSSDFFEVEQSVLKNMIRRTSFAVSSDESRPNLMGALFEVVDKKLTVVAIDGYRMAIRSTQLENCSNDFKVIIRGKTLNEVAKILNDSTMPIRFGVNQNQAVFELENCRIVTKIIEGKYVDFRKSIPTSFNSKAKVNRQDLLDSFERINLMQLSSQEKERQRSIQLNLYLDKMILSCINQVGNGKEEIVVETDGNNLIAGFNSKFFIDALRSIEDEEVEIEFTSEMGPCVIKSKNGEDYIYLILPVRLAKHIEI